MRVERDLKRASGSAVAELRARLEQSEARFRDVIERNADAIVVVDMDGTVRFANAAAEQLFGTPREELVDTDFGFPLVVGETTELDLLRRDGPPLVAEMRVVKSEWAGAPAWIASMRDVTKRAEAEQNARRLIREQAARSAAERAVERLRFLADSSTALSSSLDHGRTLAALAKLCAEQLADWAVVYVVDEQGQVGRLEVAHRDPAMERQGRAIRDHPIEPDGNHPVLEVLRTGKSIVRRVIDDADLQAIAQDERHLELLRALGVASYVLLPLLARGRPVGALALVSADRDRLFDDEDVALAEDLASHAALAVDNARLYREAREADDAKTQLL
ncbi:MAG TPA: PAS domain S-box protein, partial [Longimicrobiales bacterium]|nr:PAS domain S-box protein [Longimicrobiales bacterium]